MYTREEVPVCLYVFMWRDLEGVAIVHHQSMSFLLSMYTNFIQRETQG